MRNSAPILLPFCFRGLALVFALGLGAIGDAETPAGSYEVRAFGAVGDGETLDTPAISAAIRAAAEAGGGTVHFSAGRYLSGSIAMESAVTLFLDQGAELVFSGDPEQAVSRAHPDRAAPDGARTLVYARGKENVAVIGYGALVAASNDAASVLLQIVECRNTRIQGVSFDGRGSSADGIAIDACRDVRIADCSFNTTGGNAIVVGSSPVGSDQLSKSQTERVLIANCVVRGGTAAFALDPNANGGLRDLVASNIVCAGADWGIRLEVAQSSGAVVENLRFSDWIIRDSGLAAIRIGISSAKSGDASESDAYSTISDIAFRGATIRGAARVIEIEGQPNQPIAGIRLTDIAASGEEGLFCAFARDVALAHARIDSAAGPQFFFSQSSDVSLDDISTREKSNEPVLALHDCQDAWLRNSAAIKGNKTFVQVMGSDTSGIVVAGNALNAASRSVAVGPDVPEGRVAER